MSADDLCGLPFTPEYWDVVAEGYDPTWRDEDGHDAWGVAVVARHWSSCSSSCACVSPCASRSPIYTALIPFGGALAVGSSPSPRRPR